MVPQTLLHKAWLTAFEPEQMIPFPKGSVNDAVQALTQAVNVKDSYTVGHCWRVSRLAVTLASSLDWPEEEIGVVELAGVLHDIGKIAIIDTVLHKQDRLEGEELRAIRLHPEIGARMIMGFKSLKLVIPYILYHHERWDGSGYPYRLMGNDIPPEGRLMALCDAFDAMTTSRPYRAALKIDAAIQELVKNRASQFDPRFLDAFSVAWESGLMVEALRGPILP